MPGVDAKRAGYLIFAAAILIVAVVILLQSLALVVWTPLGPGPGFFTAILSAILGLLAVGVAWEYRPWLAADPDGDTERAEAGSNEGIRISGAAETGSRVGTLKAVLTSKPFLVSVVLVVTPFVFEPLGYRITVALLIFVVLALIERRRPLRSMIIAAATSAATYFIFGNLLHVWLPTGPWGV